MFSSGPLSNPRCLAAAGSPKQFELNTIASVKNKPAVHSTSDFINRLVSGSVESLRNAVDISGTPALG